MSQNQRNWICRCSQYPNRSHASNVSKSTTESTTERMAICAQKESQLARREAKHASARTVATKNSSSTVCGATFTFTSIHQHPNCNSTTNQTKAILQISKPINSYSSRTRVTQDRINRFDYSCKESWLNNKS